MTELSFLIELLLNHDIPKATKDLVASRIKDVEAKINGASPHTFASGANWPAQAASTMALMAKHAEPIEAPAIIAQTPQAIAALNSRAEAMANAGKIEKGQTRPRKF